MQVQLQRRHLAGTVLTTIRARQAFVHLRYWQLQQLVHAQGEGWCLDANICSGPEGLVMGVSSAAA